MPIDPIAIQRRMVELGRARLGEKGPKGEPRKLTEFRFTSASRALLEAIAALYGGEVRPWENARDEGYFELYTESNEIQVVLPPVFSDSNGEPSYPFSQWFELWSAGGCQRRCDGVTDAISGKDCLCNPDKRDCKPTTRISFMMPDIPGLGVWRIESHGYNAAAEMPGAINVLSNAAAGGKFIPAILKAEPRTKVVAGQTRHYVVPVIHLPDVSVNQIASGDVPLAMNGTAEQKALPAGDVIEHDELPTADVPTDPAPEPAPKKPTKAERDKLVKITAQLGAIDPDTDWPGMVEKAARSSFGHGVEDLSKDEIAQLLGRLVKHAETMNPAVPA